VKASLYNEKSNTLDSEELELMQKVTFKRASEIYKGTPYSVFDSGIEDGDILQGGLGNCYFLSSIAALSVIP
jgi:hypothetical protein